MNPSGRLIIGVTTECNSSCQFCVFRNVEFLSDRMSTPETKKVLRRYKDHYSHVYFTGGEPSLHKDIFELVTYAKGLGYKVQLSTNGRLFVYKDFCKKMIEAGVDVFSVSLSAHNARLYETMTRSRGSFRQATTGIVNLLSLGHKVLTNTVINQYNYIYLPDIARFLLALGLKECQFTFVRRPSVALGVKNFPIFQKNDLKAVIARIKKAIDIVRGAGRMVSLLLVPSCYMKGYEKYIKPYRPKHTKIIYLKIKNVLKKHPNAGKFVRFYKNEVCRSCKHGSSCEGVEMSSPFLPQLIQNDPGEGHR